MCKNFILSISTGEKPGRELGEGVNVGWQITTLKSVTKMWSCLHLKVTEGRTCHEISNT